MEKIGAVAFVLKLPMYLREFQEKASKFQEKARAGMVAFRRDRRNGKNVGQSGPLGNYYDACFFAFRACIGTLKKTATCSTTSHKIVSNRPLYSLGEGKAQKKQARA